jgi:transglutaminase-like putative cysteine protease/Ca2+/Na+ antiporter
MYDVKQFKPALYVLLLLGMTGFALAAEWPGIWVLSAGGVLLNAWLVKTGRFKPMPRILASAVTIVAFLYIANLVLRSASTPILIIGQFLVLLQLVKLFEQRANRDYAQLIILSLLLMVAAAINTASLIFGLMFIAYLFLSLYCCLLFHLKIESEEAKKAISLPQSQTDPNSLRQDQRRLSSSMRRLTSLIAVVAIAMAVNVFLFFPRGSGSSLLSPLQFHPSRALTGFSEQVTFQQVARITQNSASVADVQLMHKGPRDGSYSIVDGTQPLLLRGLTLDFYNGNADKEDSHFRWSQIPYQWRRRLPDGDEKTLEPLASLGDDDEQSNDLWKQKISLQPTGSSVLFALQGPATIRSENQRLRIRYSDFDGAIRLSSGDPLTHPIEYEVVSTGKLKYQTMPPMIERSSRTWGGGQETTQIPRQPSQIDPKITEYARRPDVSGRDTDGTPLVELRDKALADARKRGLKDGIFDIPSKYDEAIAANIEHYLQTHFTYTLDLTDTTRIEGRDPMVAFLYDFKRGHCEYFAGAMTLMLQGLGIPARMVIGFRCDDYNTIGHYYAVNQSQAHAWVESRVGDSIKTAEWHTWDPTSGREDQRQRKRSAWTRARQFFDFLEHAWAQNVIAYDRGSRDNLVQNLETQLTSTAVTGSQQISGLPDWLKTENWAISSKIISVLIVLAVLALIGSITWFVYERWKLRKRAARIGLDVLPSDQRLWLARQLAFYDRLLRLLERRGLVRMHHQTPMEFGDSLTFLPSEAYHAVRRLTEIFYRVRYGRQELTPGQQEKLDHTLAQLESILGGSEYPR